MLQAIDTSFSYENTTKRVEKTNLWNEAYTSTMDYGMSFLGAVFEKCKTGEKWHTLSKVSDTKLNIQKIEGQKPLIKAEAA